MTEQNKKNYKVYVIGSSTGYARWIESELTNDMSKADVVVLTGGEDISPKIYNEPAAEPTYLYIRNGQTISDRDKFEIDEVNRAKNLDKAIWGTCRGAQLLCALAGGKLVQDMSHYGTHKLEFIDSEKSTCISNSLHHQLQYPYPIDKEDYTILAYALGVSLYYHGTKYENMEMPEINKDGLIKEPEFVYYKKLRGLGIQGHPEMMGNNSKMVSACRAYLDLLISGKLDSVLKLKSLSLEDIIERSYNFKFTASEMMEIKGISKKRVLI